MENNWKEVAKKAFGRIAHDITTGILRPNNVKENGVGYILNAMELVFEATKKECLKTIDKDYEQSGSCDCGNYSVIHDNTILNIEKPNL